MIHELYTLKGVLHPAVVGDGFVLPLFRAEDTNPQTSYVQLHDGNLISAFDEIDSSEDVVLATNSARQLSIGDRPIMAFKSSSRGILVGNSAYMRGVLNDIRADYDNKPVLQRSLDRFLSSKSDARPTTPEPSQPTELVHSTNVKKFDYRSGGQAQRYLDAQKINRDFPLARTMLRAGDLQPFSEEIVRQVLTRSMIARLVDLEGVPDTKFDQATKKRLVWAMNLPLGSAVHSGISQLMGQGSRRFNEYSSLVGEFVEFRLTSGQGKSDFALMKSSLVIDVDRDGHLRYESLRSDTPPPATDQGMIVLRAGSLHFLGSDGARPVTRFGRWDEREGLIEGILLSETRDGGPFSTHFVAIASDRPHPLFSSRDPKQSFLDLVNSEAFFMSTRSK